MALVLVAASQLAARSLPGYRSNQPPADLLHRLHRQLSGEAGLTRCMTPLFAEMFAEWSRLDARTRTELRALRARPTQEFGGPIRYPPAPNRKHYDTTQGHFRIHWATTGQHAPDLTDSDADEIPDYVADMASALEGAYDYLIGQLGFATPPSDSPAPGGAEDGGNGRTDVYIGELVSSLRAMGVTVNEFTGTHPVRDDATAFIVLDNDFAGTGFTAPAREVMRSTAVHEYFHVVEAGYEIDDQQLLPPLVGFNFWWSEATATFVEDELHPEARILPERLDGWFFFPEVPLDAFSPELTEDTHDHMNGSAIWCRYLAANWGASFIKDVWEAIARQPDGTDIDSLEAFDRLLRARGSSRDRALIDFWTWNYITGPNDDGRHYPLASRYPAVYIDDAQRHSSYPVTSPATLPFPPNRLSVNYTEFRSPGSGALHISFDGEDGVRWAARLIAVTSTTPPVYTPVEMPLDANGAGSATVPWTGLDRIILLTGVVSTTGKDLTYTYSASQVASAAPRVASCTAHTDRVEVVFDTAMDSAEAGALSAYVVESPEGSPVTLSNATIAYDAARNTATISNLNLSPATSVVVTASAIHTADGAQALPQDGSSNRCSTTVLASPPGGFVLAIDGGGDGTGQTLLDLIAVPFRLRNTDPAAHLGAGVRLAAFDPTRPADDPYVIYNSATRNVTLQPGLGYWVAFDEDRNFTFDGETAVDENADFAIALPDSGWMLIGNPYTGDLRWDLDAIRWTIDGSPQGTLRDLLSQASRPLEPYLWRWDGTRADYDLVFDDAVLPGLAGFLRAGEGGFVRANRAGVGLLLPGRASRWRGRGGMPAGWSVPLEVFADGALLRRRIGVIGGTPGGLQAAVAPQAPGSARQVNCWLLRAGRRLAADLLPAGRSVLQWDLVIALERGVDTVVVSWPNLSSAPSQWRFELVDVDFGRGQSMRSTRQFLLHPAAGDRLRRLRIVARDSASSPLALGGLSVRRSRAGFAAIVTLNRSADLTMKVMTPSGRVVATLTAFARSPGRQVLVWDGRDQTHRRTPPGIYLVQVTARGEDGSASRLLQAAAKR